MAVPPSSIVPSKPPGSTVAPSACEISAMTPEAGAFTSRVTLSVSSSTSGSSAVTASPGFLNQRAIVASLTDSPRVGTRISVAIGSGRFSRTGEEGADARRVGGGGRKGLRSAGVDLVEEGLELVEVLRHQARGGRGRSRAPGVAGARTHLPSRHRGAPPPTRIGLDEKVRSPSFFGAPPCTRPRPAFPFCKPRHAPIGSER